MEDLLLLAVPVVVSYLVEVIKRLKKIKFSSHKASILQMLALTLSFVGVVAGSLAAGQDIPVTEVTFYIEGLLTFATTQVIYLFGKAKAAKTAKAI